MRREREDDLAVDHDDRRRAARRRQRLATVAGAGGQVGAGLRRHPGPFYFGVAGAQALTRDGFDLTWHAWSLLASGELGWIQVANFTLTGAMLVAFVVGLHRVLAGGRGGRWAPRLIGAFGLGMALSALVLRAEPAQGFPPGAPQQPQLTWHGALHYPVAGIAFLSLVVACFVLAADLAPRDGGAGRRSPGWPG
jgi:Protein of unknown function (DUF998)